MIQALQLQLEDIASILALAKTAKIDASDALAVGSVIERLELAMAFAKLQRMTPPEQPTAPDKTDKVPAKTPSLDKNKPA